MAFDRPSQNHQSSRLEPVPPELTYDHPMQEVGWDHMLQHGNDGPHHTLPRPGQTTTLPQRLRNPGPDLNWSAQPTPRSLPHQGPFDRSTVHPARTTLQSPVFPPYNPAREDHTFIDRANRIEPANSSRGYDERDMDLIDLERRFRRLSLIDSDEELFQRIRSFLSLLDVYEQLLERRLRILLLLFAVGEEESISNPSHRHPSEIAPPRDYTNSGPAYNDGYNVQPSNHLLRSSNHFLRNSNRLLRSSNRLLRSNNLSQRPHDGFRPSPRQGPVPTTTTAASRPERRPSATHPSLPRTPLRQTGQQETARPGDFERADDADHTDKRRRRGL